MSKAWLLEELSDLVEFSRLNGLLETSTLLSDAIEVAKRELKEIEPGQVPPAEAANG